MKFIFKHWRVALGGAIICYVALGIWVIAGEWRLAGERETRAEAEMLMFHSSDGPFALNLMPNGQRQQGERLAGVRPGQVMAYVNTVCLRADVEASGELRLRRMEDGAVVWRLFFVVPPAERPCGSMMHTLQIPADARPGEYRLLREDILLRPAQGVAQTVSLPPLRITVTP